MPVKIAINGYGRVGRMVLRALYEQDRHRDLRIIAVNDLGDASTNARFDAPRTVHGPFPFKVDTEGNELNLDGDRIKVFAERAPSKLPWAALGVDVVPECTDLFTSKEKASAPIPSPEEADGDALWSSNLT